MNIRELDQKLSTQDECLTYIEQMRWPDGVRCVTCGSAEVYRVQSSSKKQIARRLFECAEPTCRQQFTATSGTIMHDTHLPLKTWLLAICLITQAKKGMSAKQLQRHLGIGSYRTAWHLSHRIREAMRDDGSPLGGVVEVDETYVGGKLKNKGVFAGRRNKTAVLGAISREGDVKLKSVEKHSVDSDDARQFVESAVDAEVQMICTDESVIYPFALTKYRNKHWLLNKHFTVNHKAQEYVRFDIVHTNSIEGVFSLLKRGIIGNFHQVSTKHLHRYLSEFEFRFNARKDDAIFHKTAKALTQGRVLPYAKLVA